jgi:pyruvate/2-oxoglutarate dehydrogenase complex dihydrolipoamide acyltransferase (E2) component
MLTAIKIPALDSSSEKATLLRVLVKTGDRIEKSAVVAEIETEKTSFPVESPFSGAVVEILAAAGAEISVGHALVTLETTDAGAEPFDPAQQPKATAMKSPAPANNAAGLYSCTEQNRVLFNAGSAAPIPFVPPPRSFGGGEEVPAEKFAARDVPVADSRKLIGSALKTQQRMLYSARNIPTSSVSRALDISALRARVEAHRAATRALLNPTDVIIWAAVHALRDFPELNAYRNNDELRLYANVNIGVVYDLKGELIVPAIEHAAQMSVAQVSDALRGFFKDIAARKLTPAKLGIATFTISNLFGAGAIHAHPIVNAGQSAVLVIGSPFQQPVSDESGVRFVEHVNLVLGFDHTIVNGVRASAFLKSFGRLIEQVEFK